MGEREKDEVIEERYPDTCLKSTCHEPKGTQGAMFWMINWTLCDALLTNSKI